MNISGLKVEQVRLNPQNNNVFVYLTNGDVTLNIFVGIEEAPRIGDIFDIQNLVKRPTLGNVIRAENL